MTRHPHYPPACPTCGASLPHDNPMSLRYHYLQEEKRLFDAAVVSAKELNRPFEDHEVFQDFWDLGFELVPQMDDRFEVVKEATGTSRPLWGLKSQEGTKQ